MERQRPSEPVDESTASAHRSNKAVPEHRKAAWSPVGDGRWLPYRVRGSNRGRALG